MYTRLGWSRVCASICWIIAVVAIAGAQSIRHHHRRPIARKRVEQRIVNPFTIPASGKIQVNLTASHILNRFEPDRALGAGVDAIGVGGGPTLFSPSNIQYMLSSGVGSISYRLYTELNVQDWHWNPNGTWSDATNHQGYFVGSTTLGSPITDSYGFQLMHRGDTFDQGDNQDYSRITDGDLTTYWKSNPYLTSTYTHESDSLHPQWVVVDLGTNYDLNAIQINWAAPYAVSYSVQYWTGDDAIYDPTNGSWVTFPNGAITKGSGGTVTLKLSSSTVNAEFIRILMSQSSNTFDSHGSSDPRNGMGYAIYEVGIGTLDSNSNFSDLVSHSANQNQTVVYTSSTDPWHTSNYQNPDTEQAGLDFVLDGKLAQKLPAMVPVPLIYSTPDNAVAEMTYLTRRKYPIAGIELGEEPDGQFMTPEDYGAFYVQWATAIHKIYPQYKMGGPIFSNWGVVTWPDATGETDWLKRFVAYLTSHKAASLLSFVSTEHYPFDATTVDWSLLAQEPPQVSSFFSEMAYAQLPKWFPLYVTEYNFTGGTSVVTVDLMGALWQTIFVGEFMNRGGSASFYYQYLPYQLYDDSGNYGILGMFTSDSNDQVNGITSQFYSNQMLTQDWCLPDKGEHILWPATTTIKDSSGNPIVMPYVVSRPDGQYAVLLVNTDSVSHSVQISFVNSATHYFSGNVAQSQLSQEQYVWIPDGVNGYAKPDGPIAHTTVSGGSSTSYSLPAYSITVLRGKIH